MHHLCLVRGVNTSEDDHGKGAYMMLTGRRQNPASEYPQIGAVAAKALMPADSALPGYILITPGGGGGRGNDVRLSRPQVSQAFNSATATRRKTPRDQRRSPKPPKPLGRSSAGTSTSTSSTAAARP